MDKVKPMNDADRARKRSYLPDVPVTRLPDRRKPGEKVADLGPLDWLHKVGTMHAREVCAAAGVGYERFKHVAHGRKFLSPHKATAMVRASGGGLAHDALTLYRRGPDGLPERRERPAGRTVAESEAA